jgi:hypothetical protein
MNDFALLILRLVAGGYIVKYGFPKLRDVDGSFAKEFESLGFHPAATYVKRAALVEVISGAISVDSALNFRVLDRAWLRRLSVPVALAGSLFLLSQRTHPPATED